MHKLKASILKDLRLLLRDKVGLILMFAMPILLVLVITSLQNNTFKIVNDHQVPLVIFDHDADESSFQLREQLQNISMFDISVDSISRDQEEIATSIKNADALVGLVIKKGFSNRVAQNAENLSVLAMSDFSEEGDEENAALGNVQDLEVLYSPVLQESYRMAVEGALQSAMRVIQSRKMLNLIYASLNGSEMPKEMEDLLLNNEVILDTKTITNDGSGAIPNATQHNVPAWTIFAMFFMVTSLGSSLVREKRSGSFIRLKTMPGGYFTGIIAKQLVYLLVALAQVLVIFSIGIWIFPLIGLPKLNLPEDLFALFVVSVISGLCAISYALCIGVLANTEEQANGFGAVSIVILAALGGILVPSFAMPDSFRIFTSVSPLHWCLQSFYELFLASGSLANLWPVLWPIIVIIVALQLLALAGLKKKNLI